MEYLLYASHCSKYFRRISEQNIKNLFPHQAKQQREKSDEQNKLIGVYTLENDEYNGENNGEKGKGRMLLQFEKMWSGEVHQKGIFKQRYETGDTCRFRGVIPC